MGIFRKFLGPAVPFAGIYGGEAAARDERGACGWVNELTPGGALIVVTRAMAPLLVYNLPLNACVFISQYCYAVETLSDSCTFEIGWTDAINGAGTFHPLGPHKHVYTGAANTGRTSFDQEIIPAEPVRYSQGARSITFRVEPNDQNCQITMGWHGWWEYDWRR